jgi:hypothetical protein
MANSLTNILPKILAKGLLALRQTTVMTRLVNTDYGSNAAMKGSTIDIPTSSSQTVSDVTAAPTYSSAASNTPGVTQINLDQWKKTNFFLTDKDMAEIDRNEHFIPMQTAEAAKAMGNNLDVAIHGNYTGVYGYVGTAGTTPFSTIATTTGARKVLNEQLCPTGGRNLVMDPTAEAQALALAAYRDMSVTGDGGTPINGEIGAKLGFDHFMSQNVLTHTRGTATASVSVGSTSAIGTTSLKIAGDGALGTIVTGDVFTIAGDTQTYTVTGATVTVTSAGVNATITPALAVIASATSVITIKGSHVVNLAFTREAFAFATRPLQAAVAGLPGSDSMMQMTDPESGVSMRIEVSRQNKQNAWEFDFLYGTKLVRPELACRIAG